MVITCSNKACGASMRVNIDALTPGKSQGARCPKCGTVTRFVVPGGEPTVPPAGGGANLNKTVIIDRGASRPAGAATLGRLEVVASEQTPAQVLPLKEGRNTLGRRSVSKPADLMIDTRDAYMSRNHATLDVYQRADGCYQYVVSDCGSPNGTFVNETRRLTQYDQIYLQDGDSIRLGNTRLRLVYGEAACETDAPATNPTV